MTVSKAALSLFLIFILSCLSSPAFAVSEEEKSFLTMYFSDEELEVVSATRSLKSITRVAENIDIVTKEDIELMNAHTVAEALFFVTGVEIAGFVGPGTMGLAGIHGSDWNRVTVLLDGVPLQNANDSVSTGILPVQMIERIEIIKGPASSAWGSSFGGVINIITKSVGQGDHYGGQLYASGGERSTSDARAEAFGRRGNIGLYLFGGTLNSSGLRDNHPFWNNNLFSKVTVDAGRKTAIDASFFYHKGNSIDLFLPSADYDFFADVLEENIYGRVGVSSELSKDLHLSLSGWLLRQHALSYERTISTGEGLLDGSDTYNKYGLSGSISWHAGAHTVVAGSDLMKGRFESTYTGETVKQWKYALYVNDTINVGDLSITPGLRYDKTNLGGDILSPSIGVTYALTKELLVKASAARGFHAPAVGEFVSYPEWPSNPDLGPEKIWSYQAGVEVNVKDLFWLMAVFFRHDISDIITQIDRDGDGWADFTVNAGKQRVYGGEARIRTKTYHGFTFEGGFSYEEIRRLDFSDDRAFDVTRPYGGNVSLSYNNGKGLRGVLNGHYFWWNEPALWEGKYNGFVTDINIIKEIIRKKDVSLDVFVTGHNIFNAASSYDNTFYKLPSRWFEAGVRMKF